MIKETKIGSKIFIEQTTYYVYESEYARQIDSATITTSSKKEFDKAKKRVKDSLKKELTPKQKLYKNIYDKVYNYKTKNKEGFIQSEVEELLKDYPNIDMDKFNDALNGITCIGDENNNTIYFRCDIEKALLCGIERRELYSYEVD